MRFFITATLFFATSALAAEPYPVLVYPCHRAEAALKLDGRLDEPVWNKAPLVSGFTFYDRHELAPVQTALRALYDDVALYVGVQCDEPLWRKLSIGTPGVRDDHAAVFGGESIEIFVDPRHDHANYFQIAANLSGTIYDARGTDSSWNGKAQAVGVVSEGQWTLEISITWADVCSERVKPGMVIGRHFGIAKKWVKCV